MSRRKIKLKKIVNADSIYNSILVSQLINKIMKDGKKNNIRKNNIHST